MVDQLVLEQLPPAGELQYIPNVYMLQTREFQSWTSCHLHNLMCYNIIILLVDQTIPETFPQVLSEQFATQSSTHGTHPMIPIRYHLV